MAGKMPTDVVRISGPCKTADDEYKRYTWAHPIFTMND